MRLGGSREVARPRKIGVSRGEPRRRPRGNVRPAENRLAAPRARSLSTALSWIWRTTPAAAAGACVPDVFTGVSRPGARSTSSRDRTSPSYRRGTLRHLMMKAIVEILSTRFDDLQRRICLGTSHAGGGLSIIRPSSTTLAKNNRIQSVPGSTHRDQDPRIAEARLLSVDRVVLWAVSTKHLASAHHHGMRF